MYEHQHKSLIGERQTLSWDDEAPGTSCIRTVKALSRIWGPDAVKPVLAECWVLPAPGTGPDRPTAIPALGADRLHLA